MKIRLEYAPPTRASADLAVVILDEDLSLHELQDTILTEHVARASAGFRDKTLKHEYFTYLPEGAISRALVVYWNPVLKSWSLQENVKTFTARALRLAREHRLPRVMIAINGADAAPFASKIAEGAILGAYHFDKYRQERDDFLSREADLRILVHPDHRGVAESGIRESEWVSENVNLCRDLVNEPGGVATPRFLATRAEEIACSLALEYETLDRDALRASGYDGLVRVGQGSLHPPFMTILRHVPAESPSQKTLALVGKGITFDSGGISIKPSDRMWEMKGDMAGAAVVLATMRALTRFRPDLKIIGVLCCAENLPDARAQRPGDIITFKNGKSVTVDNTDAEGRLVLIDGIARAVEEGATHILDIATLTGAVVRALGTSVAGILGTDRDLIQRVIQSGIKHGEVFWELPLVEEYRESMKTPFADINNVASNGLAGAITGALFLREFVPDRIAWAHLDIAGPIFKDKEWKYYEAGAIGFGVKTLVDLCKNFNEPLE
ncbi:MAG: leucyl aminopeptidase [Vicinamibacteria bacterium]|nr:leucyl aminopeptidase [Vicinamibacteria bacterium]